MANNRMDAAGLNAETPAPAGVPGQPTCAKCGGVQFKVDTVRCTGDGFSRFFDVQNKRFKAVTCEACGFTEFYRAGVSKVGSVLDFLIGG